MSRSECRRGAPTSPTMLFPTSTSSTRKRSAELVGAPALAAPDRRTMEAAKISEVWMFFVEGTSDGADPPQVRFNPAA